MDTLICLDIDGTITEDKFSVPPEIVGYLEELSLKGYPLFFETGRSFSFAQTVLKDFTFPYYISPQNGSVILKMPEKKVIFKQYLDQENLEVIEKVFHEFPTDFILYSGFENKDLCYYREKKFSKDELDYIAKVEEREHTKWVSVAEFGKKLVKEIPLVKGFGPLKTMQLLKEELQGFQSFQVSINKDPFIQPYHLLLVTHKNVSKGSALSFLKNELKIKKVVAAGDDDNDQSMLLKADVKIVINTASEELKCMADMLALRPNDLGIITALKEVLGC